MHAPARVRRSLQGNSTVKPSKPLFCTVDFATWMTGCRPGKGSAVVSMCLACVCVCVVMVVTLCGKLAKRASTPPWPLHQQAG